MNLDVHVPHPRERHSLAVARSDAFILVNDHDPKPIYYTFHAELPGRFSWPYLEQGPEIWRVRIGKAAPSARSGSGSGAGC
jgi:uncharacterized protein (DUF2249 family)